MSRKASQQMLKLLQEHVKEKLLFDILFFRRVFSATLCERLLTSMFAITQQLLGNHKICLHKSKLGNFQRDFFIPHMILGSFNTDHFKKIKISIALDSLGFILHFDNYA